MSKLSKNVLFGQLSAIIGEKLDILGSCVPESTSGAFFIGLDESPYGALSNCAAIHIIRNVEFEKLAFLKNPGVKIAFFEQ